jgi:hypothetical protein
MEHISTLSKSDSAKPVFLSVINSLSTEHETEWQSTFVGTIVSGFESPIFIPDISKYTLHLAFLRFLSISCEEERNILHRIKQRKPNCIGHMLRSKCFLTIVTEEKIRAKERRRRTTTTTRNRLQQLRNDYKDMRGYWKLQGDALDRTL